LPTEGKQLYIERVEIIFFLLYFIDSVKNPWTVASSNPFQRGSQGCGIFVHQNHAAGEENSSIVVGMFVCLCIASQNPFDQEFFIPTRTDFGG